MDKQKPLYHFWFLLYKKRDNQIFVYGYLFLWLWGIGVLN